MRQLATAILAHEEVKRLLNAVEYGGCPAVLIGVSDVHTAHIAAALRMETERPVVIVAADERSAANLCADMSFFLGEELPLISARDWAFYEVESQSRETEQRRLRGLNALLNGGSAVITVEGLMQRAIPRQTMRDNAFSLVCGEEYDLAAVAARLVSSGYTRCDQVEGAGQFALRGGILDFFSPAAQYPVRCEFFGDELDSMGYFDVSTQRRTEMTERVDILPASETLVSAHRGGAEGLSAHIERLISSAARKKSTPPALMETLARDLDRVKGGGRLAAADRYMDLIYEKECAADYISEDAVVILSLPARLKDRAQSYEWQMGEDVKTLIERGVIEASCADFYFDWNDALARLAERAVIMADAFTAGTYPLPQRSLLSVAVKTLPAYNGNVETAAGDITHYMRSGFRTVVLCASERRAELFKERLDSYGIPSALDFKLEALPDFGECKICVGGMSAGVEYTAARLAVITEGQMIQVSRAKRRGKKRPENTSRLESFTDLSPGDIVVHERYGIGRFVGIFKMPVDGVEKDYIKIAYAGTDALYVPATQLDAVSKYIGAGENQEVKLSKMGGAEWKRAKSRAKGAAKEMAKELIALQAERTRTPGYAFSEDSPWQTEFEEKFEYTETDDQLLAIEEIKKDMQRPVPMDRLLCGDVGYGKTEVALRAVMKCVLDGKQAAILAPTTVLAQQHFATASRRFAGFPVEIALLSRFRTAAEIKKALADMKSGKCDIVIGTHKLLQKDIEFKDLGLLIVDEEQRFGVAHKERLKELARQVDVLTLSATPIPRTLNMALTGLRDMSTLEEPPFGRRPVQTYVLEHNWGVVCDAVRRETERGGQVYYLHNRVENIERTASRLQTMLGDDITIAAAHGKMDEKQLYDVMERMSAGEIQVLVCTTIIETGIDIPNVNTLIIENADHLGLSQLHQLRGRIGRSNRRAYCYLTFKAGKSLTEIAEKRLSAVREFAEFNSGFKIAMRDLEIRGAGNILGAEQSGHMTDVGYDLYLRLLEEAVLEEKGERTKKKADCTADLSVSARIPESYVPSAEQRMDLYRRIAHIRTEVDADDVTDELIDRYGDPPRCVNTLIHIALLRGEAASAGITEISQKKGSLRFVLEEFDFEKVSKLCADAQYKGRLKIEPGEVPTLSLRLRTGADTVSDTAKFVRAFAAAMAQ